MGPRQMREIAESAARVAVPRGFSAQAEWMDGDDLHVLVWDGVFAASIVLDGEAIAEMRPIDLSEHVQGRVAVLLEDM